MGRIPEPPRERPEGLKHMWERHHQMARMFLLGYRNKDIAREIGMTESRVSIIRSSPIFAAKVAQLRHGADGRVMDIAGSMAEDAPKSLALLMSVRDGELTEDIKLRAQVAQDLLDRAGHGKINKVDARIQHLDVEAIERIKHLARARTVDAEVTDA